MVGRYLYFTKTPDFCKKLQDITFLELLHNGHIKKMARFTSVEPVENSFLYSGLYKKRYNIATLKDITKKGLAIEAKSLVAS